MERVGFSGSEAAAPPRLRPQATVGLFQCIPLFRKGTLFLLHTSEPPGKPWVGLALNGGILFKKCCMRLFKQLIEKSKAKIRQMEERRPLNSLREQSQAMGHTRGGAVNLGDFRSWRVSGGNT